MKNQSVETMWTKMVLNNPVKVMIISLLMVILMAAGLKNVTVSSDYRYFFGETNPQRQSFDSLQKVYSKDDSVLMTITPSDGVVFKEETIKAVAYLTQEAWKLPFVTRVDSVTNFQHSFAEDDDLTVKDLVTVSDFESLSEVFLAEIKQVALNDPELRNRLINEKASVTGVNVKMTFPGKSPFEVPNAAEKARDLANLVKELYPGHEIHLTGMVMLNDAFNEAGVRDVMTLMPIMYLIITILLFVILKTKAGVGATLGVMVFSILAAMGFSGWMSIPITPPSSIAPTVIMTLAIAHSIHILKAVLKQMGRGLTRDEAIEESLRQNIKPVFLTSLTTVVGFLSLNFSDTPPFHDLGNITAIGVTVSFLLSVGFLPAVISKVNLKPSLENEDGKTQLSERYSQWIDKRSGLIIFLAVCATGFLGSQISNMKINDQFVGYFDESIKFRPDSEYTIENLTGVYHLNFDLRATEPEGISNPEYLKILEGFSHYMEGVNGVVHVSNIANIYKRLNKNMHADDEEYYRLPEDQQTAAQYLLLFEMSLPYGLDLNNMINVDKSSSRVVVTLDEVSTATILDISEKASAWLRVNAPSEMYAEATSPTVMFSHITERNIHAMLWGTVIALTLITLVMVIALRSIKFGLISIIPNVIPATLAIGLWSILIGEAGFSIAFVASVTLGIIVDDTVHFLSKFSYSLKKGLSTRDSVTYALENVGSALISTSIILVAGFLVLTLSGFKLNFVLGALSALTIAIALLMVFTLLPALLHFSQRLLNKGEKNMKLIASTTSVFLLVLFIFNSQSTLADDSVDKGLWVARSAEAFDSGFLNQQSKVKMTLRNSHGQSAIRDLRIKTLEVEGDGDKSLTIFDTPKDVKGTAFLSYSHSLQADDQWLYLPSLKRVKRISSNNKSGPFMGSEFAYEDLSSQEVEKYTYKYIETRSDDGQIHHLIERFPVDKNSGYTKQVVRFDEKYWRIHQIDYFDRKGELLKTLTYDDYMQFPNGKWRALKMEMRNHQTGKSTELDWSDIKFGLDISARDFDKASLKRVR